jgi:hypothetical protein
MSRSSWYFFPFISIDHLVVSSTWLTTFSFQGSFYFRSRVCFFTHNSVGVIFRSLAFSLNSSYIGQRKNLFDLGRVAVVHNLHVIARMQDIADHLQAA